MNYYRMEAHPDASPRWFLDEPKDRDGNEFDARSFTSGRIWREGDGLYHPYGSIKGPYFIPLYEKGPHVEFNLAAFDMIVIPVRIGRLLEELVGKESIQRIPAAVEDEDEPMEILNILDIVDCIDMRRSDYDVWDEDCRPTLDPEQIRMIGLDGLDEDPTISPGIVLDPERARGHKLFRPKGWLICPICDDNVKNLFEAEKVSGIGFRRIRLSPEVPLNEDYASTPTS